MFLEGFWSYFSFLCLIFIAPSLSVAFWCVCVCFIYHFCLILKRHQETLLSVPILEPWPRFSLLYGFCRHFAPDGVESLSALLLPPALLTPESTLLSRFHHGRSSNGYLERSAMTSLLNSDQILSSNCKKFCLAF